MKNLMFFITSRNSLILLTLILFGCEKIDFGPLETRQFGNETARVQEITFPSGAFTITGDLRMPEEGGNHPVILMIHGSGEATRDGAVPFIPLIEIFLRNGYAVFSWDKPGSGSSQGSFTQGYTSTERAGILADAIQVLGEKASIDLSRVGLWGISQAGWVMPKALEKTDRISFMIVVSGGGEDGIEQGAYQLAQMIACQGGSQEDVATVEQYWASMNKATSYESYQEATQILLDIPGVYDLTGLVPSEKDNWSPWPRDIDAFFNPMDVLEHTQIPVLAFFGELDKNIDPVQGAQAYEAALAKAGNPDYLVEVLEGAGHVMVEVETGCLGEYVGSEYMPAYLEIMEFWLMER